jgi:murein DD-endopeptidase MepM/ murein hydrolase activator NlpD
MDKRRLTLIVVPHEDIETRRYELSYRRIKLLLGTLVTFVVLFALLASSWLYLAKEAARVPALRQEVGRLRAEQEKIEELARTLAEVEAQYERVRQLLGAGPSGDGQSGAATPRADLGGGARQGTAGGSQSASPIRSWPLTQTGPVTRLVTMGEAGGPGLEIAAPRDSYIRAVGPGLVREVGRDPQYGQRIVIEHDAGYESVYGHASQVFVAAGDRVEENEVIALTGPARPGGGLGLRFEVRRGGEALDPRTLVRQP